MWDRQSYLEVIYIEKRTLIFYFNELDKIIPRFKNRCEVNSNSLVKTLDFTPLRTRHSLTNKL
jgi:hypothetical protein